MTIREEITMTIQIGAKLKQIRMELGMTVREVAEKLNVDYSYLSKIENDHKIPSLEFLEILTDFYQIPMYELFLQESDKNRLTLNNFSPKWIEIIEYCQKENLNPEIILKLIQVNVDMVKAIKV
jgi:transcriptional regulator with XRE-family HTH domain